MGLGSFTAVFSNTELNPVKITLFPEKAVRFGQETLSILDPASIAVTEGESPIQLLESCEYEYELSEKSFKLSTDAGTATVISESKAGGSGRFGRLRTGQYVGNLDLVLKRKTGEEISRISVEVRSGKLEYRTDFRNMLEFITDRCVQLVLDLRSPATARLIPDPGSSVSTIGQRFSFLRSLVGSREFKDSITRIAITPHHRLERHVARAPITSRIKPGKYMARELANGSRRISLPAGHPLCKNGAIVSLPQSVKVVNRLETVDTAENRFVKFALESFTIFLDSMRKKLQLLGENSESALNRNVRSLHSELQMVLAQPFFRGLSKPHIIPIGSPVLQRKSGYREILRAWLHFSFASRLCWQGGDDVFKAGQRDVATLYEYWVFFKLLDLIQEVFKLTTPPVDKLIETTKDGFGLKLKSGRHLAILGQYKSQSRTLNVQFSYNRTFIRHVPAELPNYPAEGSWTARMRPDYTISLWPEGFTKKEAEEQELIVHIHFDAKYRVDNLEGLFGRTDDNLDAPELLDEMTKEKKEQRAGNYKRADLLKMHAYKDAIRRTAGAYVLYPGQQQKAWRGFHEILPGLGAFPLRPTVGQQADGTRELKDFLLSIVENVCDRGTSRERETYHRYIIHEQPAEYHVAEKAPERDYEGRKRHLPLSETHVLIGWVKDHQHLKWAKESGLYNLRMNRRRGSLRLSEDVVTAKYLLLHGSEGIAETGLFRLNEKGPRVFSKEELISTGYPLETGSDFYLVYEISDYVEFKKLDWTSLSLLKSVDGDHLSAPFTISFDKLLNIAHRG